MTESFDLGDFVFTLPAWTVFVEGEGVNSTLTAPHPEDGETSIVLFTDEDLAERFMAKHAAKSGRHSLRKCGTKLELLGLIVVLERLGVIYVFVDPSRRTEVFSIEDVEECIIRDVGQI